MIDWSKIERLTPAELEGLDEAKYSEDPLVVRIMTVLARAHASDLVYGGSPSVIDPSGWTKGTLEAVAVLVAREAGALDRERLTRAVASIMPNSPPDAGEIYGTAKAIADDIADAYEGKAWIPGAHDAER